MWGLWEVLDAFPVVTHFSLHGQACVAIFVDTYGEVHPLTGEVLAELAALQFQIVSPCTGFGKG